MMMVVMMLMLVMMIMQSSLVNDGDYRGGDDDVIKQKINNLTFHMSASSDNQNKFPDKRLYQLSISRYVPNIMAPMTVVLSGVVAIAANVPRFFELQVVFTMSLSWLF